MTPAQLASYRELVQYGRHLGVGGAALAELLDYIDQLRSQLERYGGHLREPLCERLKSSYLPCTCGWVHIEDYSPAEMARDADSREADSA